MRRHACQGVAHACGNAASLHEVDARLCVCACAVQSRSVRAARQHRQADHVADIDINPVRDLEVHAHECPVPIACSYDLATSARPERPPPFSAAHQVADAVRLAILAQHSQQRRHVVLVHVALPPGPARSAAPAPSQSHPLSTVSGVTIAAGLPRSATDLMAVFCPLTLPQIRQAWWDTRSSKQCSCNMCSMKFEPLLGMAITAPQPEFTTLAQEASAIRIPGFCDSRAAGAPGRIDGALAVLREGLPHGRIRDHVVGVLPAQAEELRRLAPECDCDFRRLLADGRLPLPRVRRSLQAENSVTAVVIIYQTLVVQCMVTLWYKPPAGLCSGLAVSRLRRQLCTAGRDLSTTSCDSTEQPAQAHREQPSFENACRGSSQVGILSTVCISGLCYSIDLGLARLRSGCSQRA